MSSPASCGWRPPSSGIREACCLRNFILALAREEVDAFVVDMKSVRKELADDD